MVELSSRNLLDLHYQKEEVEPYTTMSLRPPLQQKHVLYTETIEREKRREYHRNKQDKGTAIGWIIAAIILVLLVGILIFSGWLKTRRTKEEGEPRRVNDKVPIAPGGACSSSGECRAGLVCHANQCTTPALIQRSIDVKNANIAHQNDLRQPPHRQAPPVVSFAPTTKNSISEDTSKTATENKFVQEKKKAVHEYDGITRAYEPTRTYLDTNTYKIDMQDATEQSIASTMRYTSAVSRADVVW